MSSEQSQVHLAITDGTYIDLLRSSNQYTPERHDTYKRWKQLLKEYKEVEFKALIRNQQTSVARKTTSKKSTV